MNKSPDPPSWASFHGAEGVEVGDNLLIAYLEVGAEKREAGLKLAHKKGAERKYSLMEVWRAAKNSLIKAYHSH